MLVLSRKTSEQIMIGNDIVITIVDISGKNVRVGIEAPDHIQILRAELVDGPNEPKEGDFPVAAN